LHFDRPKALTFPSFPPVRATRPPEGKEEAGQRARAFRAGLRRQAQLRRAADVVPLLPGPGESLHTLLTGYFDFALVLTAILQARPAACAHLRVATLAFSMRNTEELCHLLDGGKVRRLSLLCSDFMRKSNRKTYRGAVAALRDDRGQKVTSARSHCKVVCLAFTDGLRLACEGSANLRTNRNVEQLTVVNSRGVHDWHAGWIDRMVRDGEEADRQADEAESEGPAEEGQGKEEAPEGADAGPGRGPRRGGVPPAPGRG
jgi:hypothetical protein